MAELLPLLGTLSVLLTLVGSYRLANFMFSGGAGLAGLMSLSVTVVFMLLFEEILLLFGVLALVAPVGAAYHWRNRLPIVSSTRGKGTGQTGGQGGKQSGVVCPNCGTTNDPSANFCKKDQCLQRLEQ